MADDDAPPAPAPPAPELTPAADPRASPTWPLTADQVLPLLLKVIS